MRFSFHWPTLTIEINIGTVGIAMLSVQKGSEGGMLGGFGCIQIFPLQQTRLFCTKYTINTVRSTGGFLKNGRSDII